MHGLVLLVLLAAASLPVCAQENPDANPQTDNGALRLPPRHLPNNAHTAQRGRANSATNGLWTTVISLVVIIGVLLLVGRWLRPYLGAPRGLSIEALELLGRRAIDQKVTIHLVRCGRRVLVLSVCAEGARTLSEFTDPDEVQRLIAACNSAKDKSIAPLNQDASVISIGPRPASSPKPSEGLRRA